MKGLIGHLAAFIAFGLFLTASAQASDIACRRTLRPPPIGCEAPMTAGEHCQSQPSRHPSARSLICDYALLHVEHERIYAEQHRMLKAGAIRETDIMAWRKRRDACTSVNCLDWVFANWRQYAAQKRPTRDAMPQQKKPPEAPMRDAPKVQVARAMPKGGAPALAMTPTLNPPSPQPLLQPEAPAESAAPAPEPLAQPVALAVAQPRSVKAPLTQERAVRTWGSLGALAWLGMCGVGLACWSRRIHGHWMPHLAGLYERVHVTPTRALVLGGLLAANGLLLLLIVTGG